MEQIKNSLRSLTCAICRQLDGVEIPKRSVSTVVYPPDAAPYVAIDFGRPALSDLRMSLTIGLFRMPEYEALAEAVENDPELKEGIIVDAGGSLVKPERNGTTRELVTNFLWRYLREGEQLDWDDTRFVETFNELCAELRRKSVVFHTTLPLSNLKMDIAGLDFGDELKLLPASVEELERWINREHSLPPLGWGPPQWNTRYVDKPAVLHIRQTVIGRPRPTDLSAVLGQVPRINVDHAITALRLVMNVPISVIFQEQDSEGLMASGGGTSWGWSAPPPYPVATLDQEKAAQVVHVWQRLQTSPNINVLRLPLRRWESSLLRPSLEDKLIDAWISLEALLMSGSTSELTHRAALRLAELLGKDGPGRLSIYDFAQDSYSWRSRIVHGSPPKKAGKQQELAETVLVTTEYVREALLKVLEIPRRFVPKELETDLLSRESGCPS